MVDRTPLACKALLLTLLLAACARPPAPAPVVPPPAPAVVEPAVMPPEPPPPSREELLAAYIDKVRRLIRANMVYPAKARPQGNPEALLEVRLQPDMRVRSVKLIKSSGNKPFDQAVKRAIEKAGRYPDVPDGLDAAIFMTHKIKYRLHDLL